MKNPIDDGVRELLLDQCKQLEKTLWKEAKKIDEQLFLQEDIIVTLPEFTPDFNDMESTQNEDNFVRFNIKMKPTGRFIRYTIPYDVFLMMKEKYGMDECKE